MPVTPESPLHLRRRRTPAAVGPPSPLWRRALNYLLVFATVVLFADALIGERGLVATTRARRASSDLTGDVDRLRRENGQLRERARRLREDPTTIESLAREELGLIRPGEVLVVVKDRTPAAE